ncbi:unnamed protein product [Sphagnum tenellum]
MFGIRSLDQALRLLRKGVSNVTLEPAIFMFHVRARDPARSRSQSEADAVEGALSDKYGRKYLILMPMLGSLLSSVLDIVHYSFIRLNSLQLLPSDLPLEFYYLENLYALFGGTATYYMGIYAYGADITEPNNRALRYGLYDGMEMTGVFLGTIASPYIFALGGYYGVYVARLVFVAFALLYILWFVKHKTEEEVTVDAKALEAGGAANMQKAVDANNNQTCTWKAKLRRYLLAPVKEFCDSIAKKRPHNLRAILHVELFIYFLYEFTTSYAAEIYIYMLKVCSYLAVSMPAEQDFTFLNSFGHRYSGCFKQ